MFPQIFESRTCDLYINQSGFARLFLKCVQNMNCLIKYRKIDHTILAFVADSQFLHASSDLTHWFPVDRVQAKLNPVKLEACIALH